MFEFNHEKFLRDTEMLGLWCDALADAPQPTSRRELEAWIVQAEIALGKARRMKAEVPADLAACLSRRRLELTHGVSARAGPG